MISEAVCIFARGMPKPDVLGPNVLRVGGVGLAEIRLPVADEQTEHALDERLEKKR